MKRRKSSISIRGKVLLYIIGCFSTNLCFTHYKTSQKYTQKWLKCQDIYLLFYNIIISIFWITTMKHLTNDNDRVAIILRHWIKHDCLSYFMRFLFVCNSVLLTSQRSNIYFNIHCELRVTVNVHFVPELWFLLYVRCSYKTHSHMLVLHLDLISVWWFAKYPHVVFFYFICFNKFESFIHSYTSIFFT